MCSSPGEIWQGPDLLTCLCHAAAAECQLLPASHLGVQFQVGGTEGMGPPAGSISEGCVAQTRLQLGPVPSLRSLRCTLYCTEFTATDNVMLLLMTKPFYTDNNFAGRMKEWVQQKLLPPKPLLHLVGAGGGAGAGANNGGETGGLFSRGVARGLHGAKADGGSDGSSGGTDSGLTLERLPTVYVMHDYLPSSALPQLYKAAHCFVLPSR